MASSCIIISVTHAERESISPKFMHYCSSYYSQNDDQQKRQQKLKRMRRKKNPQLLLWGLQTGLAMIKKKIV